MRDIPQSYQQSTLVDAMTVGKCDTVQRKYDGSWVRCECSKGVLRVYDARGVIHDEFFKKYDDKIPDAVCGTFIGNLLLDHSRIVLWDCWATCTTDGIHTTYQDVENLAYRNRYALLAVHARILVTGVVPFSLVQNFSIRAADELWREQLPHVCGLVFRNSLDPVEATLRIARRYNETPGDLV